MNRTWGGADYYLAKVGGLWDALLGEGRRFWIILNSDFHVNSADFWPGEYPKTWVTVTDTGASAWLDGVRSGEMFIVHGDLIDHLEFSFDDGLHCVSTGGELHTRSTRIFCEIRFKTPKINRHADSPKVDHIDLISGRITGFVDPYEQTAYQFPENPSTKVIERYTRKNWSMEGEWMVVRDTIACSGPSYFRLRGTNLAPGTAGETDEEGNPLVDPDNRNTEAIAWEDLWFYSNPVFVYPR